MIYTSSSDHTECPKTNVYYFGEKDDISDSEPLSNQYQKNKINTIFSNSYPIEYLKGFTSLVHCKKLNYDNIVDLDVFFVFILGIDRKEEHMESKIPILSSSTSFPKKK